MAKTKWIKYSCFHCGSESNWCPANVPPTIPGKCPSTPTGKHVPIKTIEKEQ